MRIGEAGPTSTTSGWVTCSSAQPPTRPVTETKPAKSPTRWRQRAGRALRWGLGVGLVLGVGAAIGGWFGWRWFDREILSTIPATIDRNTEFRIPCSVQVYAADGTRVDQFYLERRVWVPIDALPPVVWQAFVASEDRRFFEHKGVDPLGIARALIVNLRGGTTKQGGSTITQQLVKNLMVGKERSYRRKMREAVLAWRLDRELTKMELLELYVNYVALGDGNYGVEAAAQDYFGISARELDAGQAALLAGLVPAPSRYSPRRNPELAATRREQVLRVMAEEGYVTSVDASQRLQDPVVAPRASADTTTNAAFLTEARREIRRVFREDRPFLEGLQVYTALDPTIQVVAEEALHEALDALEERQGARGPVRNIPVEKRAGFLERGDKLKLNPDHTFRVPGADECFLALVQERSELTAAASADGVPVAAGPFHFRLGAEDLAKKVRVIPGKPPQALGTILTAGDVLEVCRAPEAEAPGASPLVHLRDRPWAEAAAVVLENRTGNVVALIGGYEVGLEGFVRATQAKRQPGSAFKPFVYAGAIVAGKRQTDIVQDAPFSIAGTNGQQWRPQNYDGGYHGAIPLRTAMALSLNTVAVRLGLEVGVENVTRLARSLGVRTPLRGDLTVALGSSEVTPMDLAVGYASLARGGVHVDPVYITRVDDRRGIELGRAGEVVSFPHEPPITLPGGLGERVMDAADAYIVVDMMRNVFLAGTAKRGRRPGMDFGGKTGTTSNFIDAWFVGYSPTYTVAVWIGTDGTQSLGDKETGGKAALPAWSRIMEALPNPPGARFPVPEGVVLLPVNDLWLAYKRGTAPPQLLPLDRLDDDSAATPLPPFGGSRPVAQILPPTPAPPPMTVPVPALPAGDLEEGAGDPATQPPTPDLEAPQDR